LDQANPDISRVNDTPNSLGFGAFGAKACFTNGEIGIIGEIRVPRELSGEVAKSRWLRIQSVNRVFALTLTLELQHLPYGKRFVPLS
jgi:hypothetical protein